MFYQAANIAVIRTDWCDILYRGEMYTHVLPVGPVIV